MKLDIIGCDGPYPAPGGACSGYLVRSENATLAIDMGCGVLPRLMERVDVAQLSAIVLSHLHADHMSDMLALAYALMFTCDHPIDVYAPKEPAEVRLLLERDVFRFHDLTDGMQARVGSLTLSFLRTCHTVECYAVRACENGKSIVYSGDTNLCPELSDFARSADIFLCDAAIPESEWRPEAPHLSPKLAAKIAHEANVGQFILTHIPPNTDREKMLASSKEEFANSIIAKAGHTYEP